MKAKPKTAKAKTAVKGSQSTRNPLWPELPRAGGDLLASYKASRKARLNVELDSWGTVAGRPALDRVVAAFDELLEALTALERSDDPLEGGAAEAANAVIGAAVVLGRG